ncbi:uncharacterized protein B0H18DRAFT_1142189 [Fomitopsis serialis]|uniref:uncharacterized protein n=1 Tax=Fomitopsis serialis TaxID=139415 RepID=UPI0020086150|nr:uncharacterized protein B0H18DRAFT_1142189 [Neoantrodia serialis]KAH9931363.1 hypothetical protein B0H18DRAFT_1142189 [Neoantrodia serialis]
MVELICPHDEGMPDEGGRPTIGIPDRTFGGLMRRLAHEKGDNVVAIFDCCHSGGMHRSGPASVTSETRHLPTGSQLPRPPIPETLDQYIWAWQDPDAGRGAAMVPVAQPETGFSDPEARSHVLLAACQPHQTAQEHTIDGMPRGVFTFHLLAYMRMKHGEDLTYARLVDALRKPDGVDLRCPGTLQWMAGQTPLCIGRNKHRLLFTTDEAREIASTFPIRYDKGLLYVGAGYRNKVLKGTRFVVEVPPELQIRLTTRRVVLTAESVGDEECTVGYGTSGDRVARELGRALDGKEAVVSASNLWLWAGVNERVPFFFKARRKGCGCGVQLFVAPSVRPGGPHHVPAQTFQN